MAALTAASSASATLSASPAAPKASIAPPGAAVAAKVAAAAAGRGAALGLSAPAPAVSPAPPDARSFKGEVLRTLPLEPIYRPDAAPDAASSIKERIPLKGPGSLRDQPDAVGGPTLRTLIAPPPAAAAGEGGPDAGPIGSLEHAMATRMGTLAMGPAPTPPTYTLLLAKILELSDHPVIAGDGDLMACLISLSGHLYTKVDEAGLSREDGAIYRQLQDLLNPAGQVRPLVKRHLLAGDEASRGERKGDAPPRPPSAAPAAAPPAAMATLPPEAELQKILKAPASSKYLEIYRLAATQGDAAAQYRLGELYSEGKGGLVADKREAAQLYRLAADKGYARAQCELGIMYYKGEGGLTEDEQEAIRLCRLAADQGDARARSVLEIMDDFRRRRVTAVVRRGVVFM